MGLINETLFEKKELDKLNFVLTKIGGEEVGSFNGEIVDKIEFAFNKVSELRLTIDRYYYNVKTKKKEVMPLYKEFRNERKIISKDFNEVFAIKSVEYVDKEKVVVKAKSLIGNLRLNEVELEDAFIAIKPTEEDEDVESLTNLLYEETGWTLTGAEDILTEVIEDKRVTKVRRVESVKKSWYDFITGDLCELYDADLKVASYEDKIIEFVSKKEHIDYDYEGNVVKTTPSLYLSYDNFLKSLKKVYDTSQIVTRMKVYGNDDMDISAATCMGESYIENYSYFMRNGEMSETLKNHLLLYYEMVEQRSKEWKELVAAKKKLVDEKRAYGYLFSEAESRIISIQMVYDTERSMNNPDEVFISKLLAELAEAKQDSQNYRNDIYLAEKEIEHLERKINDLIILCQKKTATDNYGRLIFDERDLKELWEFNFSTSYRNESFLTENIDQLIDLAKKKLRDKAFPTERWTIDSANFIDHVTIKGRTQWNGSLKIGDIIALYDSEENKEEFVYLIKIAISPKNKTIDLTLSNKKGDKENAQTIAEHLLQANNAMRELDARKYLLIEQKYNRLNLPKELNPKYKLGNLDKNAVII